MFGEIIDVRMLENNGRFKFQRKRKLFKWTWWEYIPYYYGDLETSSREEANKWMEGFRLQMKREKSDWTVVDDV